jgi:hypothetical protein
MLQHNESIERALLATAQDEMKSSEERLAAIKHVCQLRGDAYTHIPLVQLRAVALAMESFRSLTPLGMKDAAEAIAAGVARSEQSAARNGYARRP